MKFSVIVPVYKAEGYLEQCVESVLQQTYTDFELILVDDGSPDRCPEMCDELAEKDSRIKVLHKENGGASSARNAGLDIASGEYIMFLDSDDYWNDRGALSKLNFSIVPLNPDVAVFGCTDIDERSGKKDVSRSDYDMTVMKSGDKDRILHYFLAEGKLPGAAYVFATRRDLIERLKIRFKEGITAEDYDWVLSIFLNASNFAAIDDPFYTYRKRQEGSVTTSSQLNIINGISYTLDKWIVESEKISSSVVRRDVLNYLAHIYTTGVIMIARLSSENKKIAIESLKTYKNILKTSYWKKTKAVRFSLAIFGYRITAYMTNKAYRIRRAMVMKN